MVCILWEYCYINVLVIKIERVRLFADLAEMSKMSYYYEVFAFRRNRQAC